MSENNNLERRNRLIEEYQEYVQGIVGIMVQTMGLPSKLFDEFVAAGYLGLVEAASRFDFDSGREFKFFAFLRIRGAIIDSIRECADVSGRAYRTAKAWQAAHNIREEKFLAEEKNNKKSAEDKLAEILDTAASALLAYRVSVIDADEEISEMTPNPHDPEVQYENKQESKKIRETLATLSEKERLIIEDFYFKDRSFAEIVESYDGLSKSWVSRLHARAIESLKEKLIEMA